MSHIYNLVRSEPDERDFKHEFGAAPVSIPTLIDLRTYCPPVFDQGQLGSCTSNAGVGARMMVGNIKTLLSRLFLYYEERLIEGTVNQDSGAQMRDICKALNKYGVCEETLEPYDITKFANAPSNTAIANAVKYKINAYKSLLTLTDIRTYLAVNRKPVLMGMDVYDSFESASVAKTGIVPMPNINKEQLLGGHAVLIVGYANTKNLFIVRNSWGSNWGDKGYFYLPYNYITKKLAYDFWVIEV
jgi:C1A family cysteine protease